MRQQLAAVTDRFASFEAEALNVHVDYPLFEQFGTPITAGKTRVPAIKIQDRGKHYAYRLTPSGDKAALLFVLFHKRLCGPLANSLFNKPPLPNTKPQSRIETAYRRADKSDWTNYPTARCLNCER